MSLESRRNAKEAYMAELQYKRQISNNNNNDVIIIYTQILNNNNNNIIIIYYNITI